MPTLSIIIPTYNRADFLPITLKSIQAQTSNDYEVFIIDDGSKDNTEEVVQPFLLDPKFQYIKKENGERGAARNFGAKLANGSYINFFDSDDLMYPNHVEEAIKIINKNNHKAFHLGFDCKDKALNLLSTSKEINQNILIGNPYSCNGVILEKSFFLNHLFIEDRTLSASEDYELWFRLSAYTTFIHYPIVTTTVIQHEDRSVMVTNLEKLCARRDAFFKYAFNDTQVSAKYKSDYKKIYAFWESYIAIHLIIENRKKEAYQFYINSLKNYLPSFFTRRSLAIIKHLIF